jgi:hypothetical protein
MAASANCEKCAEVEVRMWLDVLSVNVLTRIRGGGGMAARKLLGGNIKFCNPRLRSILIKVSLRGAVNKKTVRGGPTAVAHAYPRSSVCYDMNSNRSDPNCHHAVPPFPLFAVSELPPTIRFSER